MADAKLAADLHRQSVITDDPHAFQVLGGLADNVLALLHGEEAALRLVYTYRHHDLVEEGEGSGEYVQMA